MSKALAQQSVGRNPTDRGEKWIEAQPAGGRTWRPVVDRRRRCQSARRRLLERTLESVVVEQPAVSTEAPQHLCADAGYIGEPARRVMESYGYTPHVRPRNEEIQAKVQNPKHQARRWVVEVSHSWLNRFRKLSGPVRENQPQLPRTAYARLRHHRLRKAGAPGKTNMIYG